LEQNPIEPPGETGSTPAGTVNIEAYANTRIALNAEMQRAGWLVLSEVFYPGWRVTVDGAPANLYRADYILRSVPLTAGSHRIEMWFMPDSFAKGAIISLLAGLGLILAAIGLWRAEKRRPI
jgi:uncharacterized membrane protein YfhO